MSDQCIETPAPEIHPETGLPDGVHEEGRQLAMKARLEKQKADIEWLKRPFVPKGLETFRTTRVVTNLGDVLKSA